ncbi:MAG: hypothetical protein WCV91_05510 [Candidatus Margulisiibacteriota bacterium]
MKKILLVVLFIVIFINLSLAGQKVMVKTEWMWEPAEIIEQKDGAYKVSYIGFTDREEWVKADKIIPDKWMKNQVVMVELKTGKITAEVAEYENKLFKVRWTGPDNASHEEWVSPDKLKKYVSPEEKKKTTIEEQMKKFESERAKTKGNLTEKFLGKRAEWENAKVDFFSIMGLGTGTNIYIQGSGQTTVEAMRYVNKQLTMLKYDLQLSEKEVTELINVIIENEFLRIKQEKLNEYPDEVFFSIHLTNGLGMRYGITQSSGDVAGAKDMQFYNIYSKLMSIAEKINNLKPRQEKY